MGVPDYYLVLAVEVVAREALAVLTDLAELVCNGQ
jgi:hypothetical protein